MGVASGPKGPTYYRCFWCMSIPDGFAFQVEDVEVSENDFSACADNMPSTSPTKNLNEVSSVPVLRCGPVFETED
jgi:hypothetical protein